MGLEMCSYNKSKKILTDFEALMELILILKLIWTEFTEKKKIWFIFTSM